MASWVSWYHLVNYFPRTRTRQIMVTQLFCSFFEDAPAMWNPSCPTGLQYLINNHLFNDLVQFVAGSLPCVCFSIRHLTICLVVCIFIHEELTKFCHPPVSLQVPIKWIDKCHLGLYTVHELKIPALDLFNMGLENLFFCIIRITRRFRRSPILSSRKHIGTHWNVKADLRRPNRSCGHSDSYTKLRLHIIRNRF